MTHRETNKAIGLVRGIFRRAQQRPSTCFTTKIQFTSEKEAETALRALRRAGGPNAKGMNVYRCGACRRWHTGHGLGTDP